MRPDLQQHPRGKGYRVCKETPEPPTPRHTDYDPAFDEFIATPLGKGAASEANTGFLMLGFSKNSAWEDSVVSRHDDSADALRDDWLGQRPDAAVAVDMRPDATAVDWQAAGWALLSLSETIWNAAERHRAADDAIPHARSRSPDPQRDTKE